MGNVQASTLLEFRVEPINGGTPLNTRVDLQIVSSERRVCLRIEQDSIDGGEPDVILLDSDDVERLHAMLKGH